MIKNEIKRKYLCNKYASRYSTSLIYLFKSIRNLSSIFTWRTWKLYIRKHIRIFSFYLNISVTFQTHKDKIKWDTFLHIRTIICQAEMFNFTFLTANILLRTIVNKMRKNYGIHFIFEYLKHLMWWRLVLDHDILIKFVEILLNKGVGVW